MTSLNALGIPQQIFGISGVQTGNLIAESLAKENSELIAVYNPASRKITVLNSAILSHAALEHILSEVICNTQLHVHPHIEETKGLDGNWQITLIYSEKVSTFAQVSNDGCNWPIAVAILQAKL